MALLSFLDGKMAIGAALGFTSARLHHMRIARHPADVARRSATHCVRHVGAEGDAAEPLGGDRLLLHVDRVAVVVVRADVDAHEDRAGPMRLQVTSPSRASMYTSSRSVWKL